MKNVDEYSFIPSLPSEYGPAVTNHLETELSPYKFPVYS